MTFSIVARDPETGDFGIAIASKALAVGAIAPYSRAGVGAISTQAMPNVAYGPDGLARLAAGEEAERTLTALVAADSMRASRQAGIVDAAGRAATFTGASCMDWAGGKAAPGIAVQGNILVGPAVVDRMLANVDTHSPSQYRVNGPLSNTPAFAAAFGVPEGAPVALPKGERAKVW